MKNKLGKFPAPKQHGAWAMFLIPALTAMVILNNINLMSIAMLMGFVLIFLSYQPASDFLRRYKNKAVVNASSLWWVFLLGGSGVGIILCLIQLTSQWELLLFGSILVIALNTHLWLTKNKEHMTVFGELFGVAGLTASAPIMYTYLNGNLDLLGLVLWGITFLYFGGSVFFVKHLLRNTTQRSTGFSYQTGLLAYCGFVVATVGILVFFKTVSMWIVFAFIPYIIKVMVAVFAQKGKPRLKPKQVGFRELAHSIYFFVVATMAFLIGG